MSDAPELVPPADYNAAIALLKEKIAALEAQLAEEREARTAAAGTTSEELTGLRAELAALRAAPPAQRKGFFERLFSVDD